MRAVVILRQLNDEGLLTEQVFVDGEAFTRPWYVTVEGNSRFIAEYARACFNCRPSDPAELIFNNTVAGKATVLERRCV